MTTTLEELDDRQLLSGAQIPVLDHGFVRVVDTMGDDSAIVQAARVSYGKGTKSAREDADLIAYLMRHRHSTPFEMCQIKLHMKMPIFVARQFVRHRTASINEYSCRYSEVKDEMYRPEPERVQFQSTANKQGSGAIADDSIRQVFDNLCSSVANVTTQAIKYGEQHGIAREINRINMTVAHYTEWYWCIDLRNLLHFVGLRMDEHAQHEIRVYAEVIARILQAWVPATMDAFMKYQFYAETFSLKEQELLAPVMAGLLASITNEGVECPADFSKGEWAEFKKKLQNIAEVGQP